MAKYLTNFDLNQNQLIEAVVQKLSTPPQNPVSGQIYYNTASNRLFVFNGSEWIGADAIGATMTGADIVTAVNAQGGKISLANIELTIEDGLTSTSKTSALSANQGKALVGKIADGVTEAKGYADQKVADLVDSSPAALDTLKELATALGDDPNFAATMTSELGKRTKFFKTTIGNGTLTSIDVTHNLGTRDVVVQIRENAAPYSVVICDIEMTTENKVMLKFAKAPASNQYTVTVVG